MYAVATVAIGTFDNVPCSSKKLNILHALPINSINLQLAPATPVLACVSASHVDTVPGIVCKLPCDICELFVTNYLTLLYTIYIHIELCL